MGSSGGFTLIEALVSISILTVVIGMFGAGMFQVFGIQRYWTDDIKATRTVRHSGSWLAGDALNAEAVLIGGGDDQDPGIALECAPDADPANPGDLVEVMTLEWTDSGGDLHWAVYRVDGDVLYRENWIDTAKVGGSLTLTTGVVADTVSFTLCDDGNGGSVLRALMDVTSDRDSVETLDLTTYIRKLDAG